MIFSIVIHYFLILNYFIPEHNMFRGKINRSNSRQLLNVLERLRNGDRDVITVTTLFNSEAYL
jgi:hypothetical protein